MFRINPAPFFQSLDSKNALILSLIRFLKRCGINWKLVFSFWGTFFVPLLYILNIYVAIVTPDSFKAPFELRIFGIAVAIFGLVFWVVSFLNLGSSFGVLPQKQKRVKKGLYKYFNHPMYIGISAVMIGLAIANASWQGLIFYNLILLPVLIIRSRAEEKILINS